MAKQKKKHAPGVVCFKAFRCSNDAKKGKAKTTQRIATGKKAAAAAAKTSGKGR